YSIYQGSLSAGSNYTIAFTGATFTIVPQPAPPVTAPPRHPSSPILLPLSGTELLRTAEHADAEEDRLLRGDPSDQGDRDFDVYYESRAYPGAVFSLGAGGEEEE